MDKTTENMKVGPLNSDYTRGYLDGKKAGATAVYERAQKMADALEWIKTYGPVDDLTVKFIDKTLNEWNGTGKEVWDG